MRAVATDHARRKPVVLVVEDDRSLRDGLAMNLRMEGYEVLTAADGEQGMRLAFDGRPDLVVLDVMMPVWSGLDILAALRKRGVNVPVLILSARGSVPQKVAGLNLGADDYVAKPFDLPELLARIAARLRRRRAEREEEPPLVFGDVAIDRRARRVRVGGREIELTGREFDLLCLMAAAPGEVFSREVILERVWGWDYEGTARTVDNFVASLRRKLCDRCRGAHHIRTVPGVGYALDPG